MINSMIFLKINFLDINADFVRVSFIQNALLTMVKKMLLSRDKKDVCGAILTDFPKAFDSISHGQLITKLNAFEFD